MNSKMGYFLGPRNNDGTSTKTRILAYFVAWESQAWGGGHTEPVTPKDEIRWRILNFCEDTQRIAGMS